MTHDTENKAPENATPVESTPAGQKPGQNAQGTKVPQERGKDFIRLQIDEHNASGRFGGKVITRFPPEPNGYLHIGHAKSICLNFGLAKEYNGACHLRFDDTNPTREEDEFVHSIKEDVQWLGFAWGKNLFYASDYFETLYGYAVTLINKGLAYVDDQTGEEIKKGRGSLIDPGKESPFRNRSVEENLQLFAEMRAGKFEDGAKVLRAKIDMASPNINMRDPILYRILHAHHHRTGDAWCIYPMYDFAHGQSDSLEGITHSICTLEFADHRPLYEWFLHELGLHVPQQIEFARLNISHTVMSKRKLATLVEENFVDGWDDPRMPTISGLRRRGFTPESVRNFCDTIGVAKRDNVIEWPLLEHHAREHLNRVAARFMGVLNPLKVVIENFPEGEEEWLDAQNNPEDLSAGNRQVPFSRELYIEQDDFMEHAPDKFYRLTVGREVRLRWAYFLKCERVIKDKLGNIVELRCTIDPATKGGNAPDNRPVKSTIHWVSCKHAKPAEVRLYEALFSVANPNRNKENLEFRECINPNSLTILSNCWVEPYVAEMIGNQTFQFERLGYFCHDKKYSTPEKVVLNRTVTLRDAWAKEKKKG